jgi:hypothetical protein
MNSKPRAIDKPLKILANRAPLTCPRHVGLAEPPVNSFDVVASCYLTIYTQKLDIFYCRNPLANR